MNMPEVCLLNISMNKCKWIIYTEF
jgi:hypothetical protein